jgi:hypothetical protein
MPTWTALTTLPEKPRAEALGEALETLSPEPVGVGIFEMEDGSGLWEVGAYFTGDARRHRAVAAGRGSRGAALRRVGTARDRLGRPCKAGVAPGRGGALLPLRLA